MSSNDAIEAYKLEIFRLKSEIKERSEELQIYRQQNEDNNEYIETLENRCDMYLL